MPYVCGLMRGATRANSEQYSVHAVQFMCSTVSVHVQNQQSETCLCPVTHPTTADLPHVHQYGKAHTQVQSATLRASASVNPMKTALKGAYQFVLREVQMLHSAQ